MVTVLGRSLTMYGMGTRFEVYRAEFLSPLSFFNVQVILKSQSLSAQVWREVLYDLMSCIIYKCLLVPNG